MLDGKYGIHKFSLYSAPDDFQGLTFGLAAGAGLTVMILCLRPNCQKSRRSPSGHSPGQLQPGGAIRLTETLFLEVRHSLPPGDSGGW
jgi:hypothetical protein